MDEAIVTPPTYKLNFSEQIYCVELSPYEWSQRLICIALTGKITIGIVKFQDEDDDVEDIDYCPIRTFHHETRADALSWSPETSLSVVPKVVVFCVAGADFKIRLYNSNLNDINTYQVLDGHTDYINSISYELEGDILASVSDDHTCKLWDTKEEKRCNITFYLTSPGMSVCWHKEETGKLLVAEKNGSIRMYNIISQQAILSLDTGVTPLMSADWGANPLKVAAMAAGELLVWDVSRPSRPMESRPLHVEGGQMIKFYPAVEYLLASIGRPDNELKVINLKSKQVVLTSRLKLVGGMSWHHKLPFICAGNDRDLCFWKLNLK
ncbi:nucleoporin Nup37 [Neodiprion pinetum]|uniref:Nucleoporin Nup37 n=1 Tax=Neodiprion lecontei TaxID=441921 RepID=A0A6J0BLZ1_NEOLC|nr:nucleoporin Nup37 [Neodiprion lecontei]XP_046430838.1 nucleoporin Nup37 [Neodiprion fabricii]XP_046487058.1 nucleoporin Nup37 [Neodiprion pinetum]XP_046625249.1 nucleoporin Nup37 [Neodiprion virginianus]